MTLITTSDKHKVTKLGNLELELIIPHLKYQTLIFYSNETSHKP